HFYLFLFHYNYYFVRYNSMNLSPRSYNRILKVARTVADLDESEDIRVPHLAEAMSYRMVEVINEG
ncbi:MAG: hypothetical protein HUJ75_00070, partial [Parasporobacterium sp.]|nr:hypothetical protein [Parasporobacterium sp.]